MIDNKLLLKRSLLASALSLAVSGSSFASEFKDRLIIKYKDSYVTNVRQGDNNINHLSALSGVGISHQRYMFNDAQVIQLDRDYSDQELEDILDKLKNDNTIEYVEEDRLLQRFATANDTFYTNQWHYYEAVGGINLEAGWDVSTGLGATIAVIDTGYRPHVDLVANIVGGYDMISDATVGNDGDGRDADPSDPGDWLSANECGFLSPPQDQDSSWHGTHVAGTIAAVTNNNQGVAGIAFDAQVVPVRVLGKCGGYTSDIADGMVWASGGVVSGVPNNPNPAQVLNLSLGGQGSCSATSQTAINTAVANGSVVVVAAGNSDADVSGFNPGNCNNVISVAATDRNADRAYYSNYGALIDIAAPGGDVTVNGGADGVASTLNDGTTVPGADTYVYYQGTSMAAPHVAGVAALMYSINPALTPAEVEAAIKASARSFPGGSSCNTSNCGDGLLDAAGALATVNVGPQLTANNSDIAVCSNQSSIDYVLNLTDFTGSTNMSVTGCPSGATCNFSVNPVVSPVNTTDLTVANIPGVAAGQYNFTATGTDSINSAETDDVALSLSVLDSPAMPTLNSPSDDSYVSGFTPTLSWSSTFGTDFFIEVDDDPGFGSVDFSDNTSNGVMEVVTSQLNAESCYYWRVTPSNICGNGSTSVSRRFYTGTGQNSGPLLSQDVPINIIDDSSNTSELIVSGVGVLSDVNVIDVIGTHAWMADVEIELTSPEGTTVKIMASSCGSDDDFDLNFDDEASPGNWPCPPTDGGSYQPSNPLSAFDGENADGTWTLTVYDIEAVLDGSLSSWGLEFEAFADTGNHCAVANVDPTAVDDNATLTEDDPATVLNVLNNDIDPDGGLMEIISIMQGSNGTVVNQTTHVTYEPDTDFCGSDSFTYTLNGLSVGTVNVTVDCEDDAPVAVADTVTLTEDDTATTIDVLDNDTDVDGGQKDVISVTQAANGAVVNQTSSVTYQPNADYCGADSFTYTLNGNSVGTVNVTVDCEDDDPVAVNDVLVVTEDAAATSVDVLDNDTDVDGGQKDVISVTQAANGAVVNQTSSVTYQPNADYCGADSFTYTLNGNSVGTVNVTVDCEDDDPVAVNDVLVVTEDAAATSVDVLDNDTDVDGGQKDVISVTQGSNGAVVNQTSSVTYQPNADYCGADAFTYTLNGNSVGTVNVTVDCEDDAPVAVDDAYFANEDAAAAQFSVLANDTDVDGGQQDIISVTQGSNGTVVNLTSSVTYQPNADFCGADAFTYTLNGNSTATVNMTVTCVDDLPTAIDDQVSVDEDTENNAITVMANDTDIDGGPINITGVGAASFGSAVVNGAVIEYTPNADYCGTDSFTYSLNGGSSATVNVAVDCVNDQPSMTANEAVYMPLDSIANPPPQVVACQMDMGNAFENNSQQVNDMLVVIAADPNGVLTSVDVDNSGQMTYGFTGQSGEAQVLVSLQDDGGNANGGNDISTEHMVTIYVHDYLFINGFDRQACD